MLGDPHLGSRRGRGDRGADRVAAGGDATSGPRASSPASSTPRGHCSRSVFRISNTRPGDHRPGHRARWHGSASGSSWSRSGTERPAATSVCLGGLKERLRFFHTDRSGDLTEAQYRRYGSQERSDPRSSPSTTLGVEVPMYDITTGTGDFIADGVVSHNCFARPTHEYLGLDPVGRLRPGDRREDERGRAAAGRARPQPLGRAPHRHGHEHRPVPARRGQVPAHPRDHRGAQLRPATRSRSSPRRTLVLARPRPARRGRASTPTSSSASRSARSIPRCGGRPNPGRRTRACGSRPSPSSTRPVCPAACSWRRSSPGSPIADDQLDELIGACVEAGARSISPVLLHLRPGVREHYLGWLSEAHPELMGRHTRMYRRAYAPAEERKQVSARVHGLIAKHRRRAGRRTGPRLSSRFDPA